MLTNSQLPLITQRYAGNGLCDDLLFGPDGYLYIAVADPNMDASGTPQAINVGLTQAFLESTLTRIRATRRQTPPVLHSNSSSWFSP